VGKTSVAQAVMLTNKQSKALTIKQILASGDYLQVNNCPASLAAGASCAISVAFHPTGDGSISGALSISTDASPGTQPVGLSGTGAGGIASHLSLSPGSLAFGSQEAGTASPGKGVTLTNTSSNVSLTVMTVIPSRGYSTSGNCSGKMIPPGGTCTIDVAFRPSAQFAPASYPGAVTVVDSDRTSPQVLRLSGTAVPPVTGSPAILSFGAVSSSAPQTVIVQNIHNAPEMFSIRASRDYFLTNNTCSNSVGTGSRCAFQVTFVANGSINRELKGAVTIVPSSGGFLSPEVVSLCGSYVVAAPPRLSFGSETVGAKSSPQTATLTNGDETAMHISSASITGANAADFVISNNTCDATLTTNASCSIEVSFAPKAKGSRQATLAISDDGGCSPQQVGLTGTGQ
jgi:hypothetical protein